MLLSLGYVINNYVSLCFLHLSLWKGLSCIILCFHFGIKVRTATSWDRALLILEAFFALSSASLVSSTFSRSSRFCHRRHFRSSLAEGNNFPALLDRLLGKSMATNLGLGVHIMLFLIIASGMVREQGLLVIHSRACSRFH